MEAKHILAVHDLSCHGTASLGVAIPVLTAFGHKVVALPSVMLSSTTDIDKNPIALSTTEWMGKVIERWKEQEMKFDVIYTGWLGDPKQVELLTRVCEELRHDKTIILVDPVLGDEEVLYPCQKELASVMGSLIKKAHIITPNPTEATLLLGIGPRECGVNDDGTIPTDRAKELLILLNTSYPGQLCILKSVVLGNRIGVAVRFTPSNSFRTLSPNTRARVSERTSAPPVGGTGDLFASLLIAHLLRLHFGGQGDVEDIMEEALFFTVTALSNLMKSAESLGTRELPFRALLHAR